MSDNGETDKDQTEHIQWVIIEMKQDEKNKTWQAVAEPHTLRVINGRTTRVVWYVFTPGFEFDDNNKLGVDLSKTKSYKGLAHPDKTRPGCWTAKLDLDVINLYSPDDQNYSVNIRRIGKPDEMYCHDPVIENDPATP